VKRKHSAAATLFLALTAPAGRGAPAGTATGTITYRGRSVALAHAWLVRGPDAVDEKKILRRLVLTANDVGAKIAACASMACVDALVTEGVEIDFDAGPRLNYWLAIAGQKVQYSGTADPGVFEAKEGGGRRLAGRIAIDDSAAGGPTIASTFDAPLVVEPARSR
jgi:hypothetical protein